MMAVLPCSWGLLTQRPVSFCLEALPCPSLGRGLKMDLSHVPFLVLRMKEIRKSKASNLFLRKWCESWTHLSMYILSVTSTSSCEEAEKCSLSLSIPIPRRWKDQIWEPFCWVLPSLSSIFFQVNEGCIKVVPLIKRMTSVPGISLWHASTEDKKKGLSAEVTFYPT